MVLGLWLNWRTNEEVQTYIASLLSSSDMPYLHDQHINVVFTPPKYVCRKFHDLGCWLSIKYSHVTYESNSSWPKNCYGENTIMQCSTGMWYFCHSLCPALMTAGVYADKNTLVDQHSSSPPFWHPMCGVRYIPSTFYLLMPLALGRVTRTGQLPKWKSAGLLKQPGACSQHHAFPIMLMTEDILSM